MVIGYCPKCGTEIEEGEKFCKHCGIGVNEEKVQVNESLQKIIDYYDIKEEKDLPVVNARPVICIIIGLAFSFALKLVPAIKLSTFLVLIVTAVLYAIVAKAGAEKKA